MNESTKFIEISAEELVMLTILIRQIKPKLNDFIVFGIEQPLPNDKNIVFHLANIANKEFDTTMISIEFLNDKLKEMYIKYGL
jgi:hypothetical protein